MKGYNLEKGIIINPIHFFRKGNCPEIYLRGKVEEHPSVVSEEMWSRLMNNHDEEIKVVMTKEKDFRGNEYWGCPLVTDGGDEVDMFYGTSKIGYLYFDIEKGYLTVHEYSKKKQKYYEARQKFVITLCYNITFNLS